MEVCLYRARFYYMWDKQMTSNVAHLKDHSIELYQRYITFRQQCVDMQSPLEQRKALAVALVE